MKRLFLFAATVLLVSLSIFAIEHNVVAIYRLDGEKALFAFADQPEVTYTTTDLVLTSAKISVQYPISQLKKIRFETSNGEEGMDELSLDKRISFRDGSIVITGGEPNSLVNIYTVSGSPVTQYRLDGNGDAVIPTQGLSGNAYILTNGSLTFKFIAQ